MTRLLVFAFLFACTSGESNTDAAIAAYEEDLAALDELVTEHVSAVAAAASLEDVATLEASYATEWATRYAALEETMTAIEGCEMDDEDMGLMDDAMMTMEEMDTTVADHMAGHDAHTDVAECQSADEAHGEAMGEHMTTMMGHPSHWEDSMMCGDGAGMRM